MSVFSNPFDRAAGGAEAYLEAVLELVGDRDPIEVLRALPAALAEATNDLSAEQLRLPEAPGKWSTAALLAHLADSEIVWAYRLRLVLAEADPILVGFDQDRWAEKLGYDERDARQSLEEIAFLRRANLRLLEGLSPEELGRSGRHNERGRESVRHMLRAYAGHDLVHCRQLERIRRRVRGEAGAPKDT